VTLPPPAPADVPGEPRVGPGGGVDAPAPDDRPLDATVGFTAELETDPCGGSELDGGVADDTGGVVEGVTPADEAAGGGGKPPAGMLDGVVAFAALDD